MKLCVFDTHTLRTRETMLTPREDASGASRIGITIRFDLTQDLSKHTLHVLDVFPNSPASAAGLDAYNDYILGVGDLLYDGPDEFGEIVLHNEKRPVRLYVYSVRTEAVREVIITPDRSWGGDGCLGCGVGAGFLHKMPPRRDLLKATNVVPPPPQPPPPQLPGEPLGQLPGVEPVDAPAVSADVESGSAPSAAVPEPATATS